MSEYVTKHRISSAHATAGLGVSQVASIVLIILKAFDKIDISWFAALTSFFWIPVLLYLLLGAIMLVLLGVAFTYKLITNK
jgi:hypothetical protein